MNHDVPQHEITWDRIWHTIAGFAGGGVVVAVIALVVVWFIVRRR